MKQSYVYLHRKKTDHSIFYVGIGYGGDNYKRVKVSSNRSDFWKRVVVKYGVLYEIVHDNLSWEDACRIEADLIKKYGRIDNGTGILVNMTDGGEGSPGMIRSKEVRDRISESMKGKAKWNIGKKASEETRAKLRAAKIGRVVSDETRLKIGAFNKNKTVSEETRSKLRAAQLGREPGNKGKPASDATRLKNSLSHKGKIPWNKGKKGAQVAWNKGLKKTA